MTEKQEHSKKFKIIICSLHSKTFHMEITAQKMKFSIKDSLSKCDQIHRKQYVWLFCGLALKGLKRMFTNPLSTNNWTRMKQKRHRKSRFSFHSSVLLLLLLLFFSKGQKIVQCIVEWQKIIWIWKKSTLVSFPQIYL